MKVIEGGLQPGEQPKEGPSAEPWLVPSLVFTLTSDGQIVMTVSQRIRPSFRDKSTPNAPKRYEFQLMPGKKISRIVTYKSGEEYTITIERKPSDTINLSQAKRAKKEKP